MAGWWFDRTEEYQARRRGESLSRYEYAEQQVLGLVPLPCWEHETAEERQRLARALVREIETETRARLEAQGSSPLGRKRILRQHPHDVPARSSRSPAPASANYTLRTLGRGSCSE